MNRYVALVHRSTGKKASWGVSFPDFPGCIAVENGFEEAADAAAEALRFHVEGMLSDGLAIPRPRRFADIAADPELSEDLQGALVALVPLLPPSEGAERVNVSLDRGLLREIDAVAKSLGSSRSGFLAAAARDRLEALAVSGRKAVTGAIVANRARPQRRRG